MALGVAFQIGKQVFQIALEGLLGLGAVANGISCLSGVIEKCTEGEEDGVVKTGRKTQDVFLAGVRCLALGAGGLHWASFCGWIALGAAAPYVAFIGYPTLFIQAVFEAWKEMELIADVSERPDVTHREWKVGIECMRLVAQVCLVAFSVLAAVALITANPAVSPVAFLAVFIAGVLSSAAWYYEKKVKELEPQQSGNIS